MFQRRRVVTFFDGFAGQLVTQLLEHFVLGIVLHTGQIDCVSTGVGSVQSVRGDRYFATAP